MAHRDRRKKSCGDDRRIGDRKCPGFRNAYCQKHGAEERTENRHTEALSTRHRLLLQQNCALAPSRDTSKRCACIPVLVLFGNLRKTLPVEKEETLLRLFRL